MKLCAIRLWGEVGLAVNTRGSTRLPFEHTGKIIGCGKAADSRNVGDGIIRVLEQLLRIFNALPGQVLGQLAPGLTVEDHGEMVGTAPAPLCQHLNR